MLCDDIRHAYALHRRQGRFPARALQLARAKPVPVPPYTPRADALRIWRRRVPSWGAPFRLDAYGPFGDVLRWGDRVCDSLRHVETCEHGWYTDPDGHGDVTRGVVYRLSARRGVSRLLYGYTDPWNDGAAALVVSGMADDASDALRWADDRARFYAEETREHEEAYREGAEIKRRISDARETLAGACASARAAAGACKLGAYAAAAILMRDARLGYLEARQERARALRELDDVATWGRDVVMTGYRDA